MHNVHCTLYNIQIAKSQVPLKLFEKELNESKKDIQLHVKLMSSQNLDVGMIESQVLVLCK